MFAFLKTNFYHLNGLTQTDIEIPASVIWHWVSGRRENSNDNSQKTSTNINSSHFHHFFKTMWPTTFYGTPATKRDIYLIKLLTHCHENVMKMWFPFFILWHIHDIFITISEKCDASKFFDENIKAFRNQCKLKSVKLL